MTTIASSTLPEVTAAPATAADEIETPAKKLVRRGDVTKCPVCGVGIDPGAYHCAKCRNYFCYHCRARLLSTDTQVRCLNQECDYYAKLICGVCDLPRDKEEAPSVYAEPEDGYWPLWLAISLAVGAVTWYYSSFILGALIALALHFGGGYGLQRAGLNIFGRERRVTYPRTSSFRTCICCQQTVKEVVPGR